MSRTLALYEFRPFTGNEYWRPVTSYHMAFTMGFCTAPPSRCTRAVKKVFLLENSMSERRLWLKYGVRYGLPRAMLSGLELSSTGMSWLVEGCALRPQ